MPFPSPGDLPDPGIEPASPALAGRFLTPEPPGKPKSTVLQLNTNSDRGHQVEEGNSLRALISALN